MLDSFCDYSQPQLSHLFFIIPPFLGHPRTSQCPLPLPLSLSLSLSLCILGIIIKKIFLNYRLLELSHIYKFHVLNLMEVPLMDCTISRWGVRRTQQHAFEDPHLLTLKNNDNPQSSSSPLESKSRRFVGWKGDRLWVNFNSMHLHHVYAPL
jgi:hypothetical protein